MLKDIVVSVPVARIAKSAAILTICLVATAQVSHAQTTYYRNSPGSASFTERNYSYGTWASGGFVGSGYIQSNADEETAYASWKYSVGGFQVSKGLRSLPEGQPDQMWHPQLNQMSYTGGRGEARFNKSLNPRTTPASSKIWSGVQGWFSNVEFYVVEKLDVGALPIPSPSTNKVGSVTIDGGVYDLYSFPLTDSTGYSWRQWWSVRRTGRDSGVVNYVKHFYAWQNRTVDYNGVAIPGISNLVNNASVKLPTVSLLSVSLGVEANGPSEASVWWAQSTVTKPY